MERLATGGEDGQSRTGRQRVAISGAAARTRSQLSRISSSRFGAEEVRKRRRSGVVRRPPARRARRRWWARPGRIGERREINEDHAVGKRIPCIPAATAIASRVLPTPPGPVSVSNRTSSSCSPAGQRRDLRLAPDEPGQAASARSRGTQAGRRRSRSSEDGGRAAASSAVGRRSTEPGHRPAGARSPAGGRAGRRAPGR